MSINKRLEITTFASIFLLLIAGCGEQSDQGVEQQRENTSQEMQPQNKNIAAQEAEQESKREIEQIERIEKHQPLLNEKQQQPQDKDTANQAEQQDENNKEVRPIERMEPKHRAQQEWPLFSPVDTNHDGSISKEEAQKIEALDYHFKQVDRNKDGKIDRDEFGAFKAMQIRSFYKGGDSREQVGGAQGVPPENPRDEKNESTPDQTKQQQSQEEGISVKEPELGQKREIQQVERIEKDQPLLVSKLDSKEQPQDKDTANQAELQSQDEGAKMGKSERMEKEQPSFSQLDADQDGYISKEEAKAFDELAFHFKQLDQNEDGKLDSSEFGAFKAMQMRGFDHGGDSGDEYGEHGAPPNE